MSTFCEAVLWRMIRESSDAEDQKSLFDSLRPQAHMVANLPSLGSAEVQHMLQVPHAIFYSDINVNVRVKITVRGRLFQHFQDPQNQVDFLYALFKHISVGHSEVVNLSKLKLFGVDPSSLTYSTRTSGTAPEKECSYFPYCSGTDRLGEFSFKPLGALVVGNIEIEDNESPGDRLLVTEAVHLPKTRVLLPHEEAMEFHHYLRFVNHYCNLEVKVPKLCEECFQIGLDKVGAIIQLEGLIPSLACLFEKMVVENPRIKSPRGLLLWGPPGTGKTTICSHLGRELGMVPIREQGFAAGELKDGLVGGTEKNIKAMLRRAECCPWLVFALIVDEVDTLVPNRSKMTSGSGSSDSSAVGVVLTYFDGMADKNKNLFFFCATNMKLELDEAFERRIDGKYFVGAPPAVSRFHWIPTVIPARDGTKIFFDTKKHRMLVSDLTTNFSGSDMEKLTTEIVNHCARRIGTASQGLHPKDLVDCIRNLASRERIFFGANSIAEMFYRSGGFSFVADPILQNWTLPAQLYRWITEDFAVLPVILTSKLHSATGRMFYDMSASHNKALASWDEMSIYLDIELTGSTVHTLRPQLSADNINTMYRLTSDHVKLQFISLASRLNATCVKCIDNSFFTKSGAKDEGDMVNKMSEEVAQATEYERSFILFDLDCSFIDINYESDSLTQTETIHRTTLFNCMLDKIQNVPFVDVLRNRFCFVVCLTRFAPLVPRFRHVMCWPSNDMVRIQQDRKDFENTLQPCKRCGGQFIPKDSYRVAECILHSKPKPTTANQTYECCGASMNTPICSNPANARCHEVRHPYEPNWVIKKGCYHNLPHDLLNALNLESTTRGRNDLWGLCRNPRVVWCNVCGSFVDRTAVAVGGLPCAFKCNNKDDGCDRYALPSRSTTQCDSCMQYLAVAAAVEKDWKLKCPTDLYPEICNAFMWFSTTGKRRDLTGALLKPSFRKYLGGRLVDPQYVEPESGTPVPWLPWGCVVWLRGCNVPVECQPHREVIQQTENVQVHEFRIFQSRVFVGSLWLVQYRDTSQLPVCPENLNCVNPDLHHTLSYAHKL